MKHRKQQTALAWFATATATAIGISACSGGGSNGALAASADTLNGTALTGAPLSGGTISVKDKTGTVCATATSNANGIWSAPLSICAGEPYLIKAVGTDSAGAAVTFFSAATGADVNSAGATNKQVNVSQLTDAIVKVLLKTDSPDSMPPATMIASVTTANLQITSQNILTALVPSTVLGAFGTGDIRTMTVIAGSGTGLDSLHDHVPKVEVTLVSGTLNAVATVTNINADGATAVTATTVPSNAAPTAALLPPPVGTVINNVTVTTPTAVTTQTAEELVVGEVTQMLKEWDKVYADGLPATNTSAFSFSDACYLDDGQDKPSLMARWADPTDIIRDANKYRIGATRSNLAIVPGSLIVTNNADGSKTRHVKTKYDVNYADGTIARQVINNLVFGNSAKACAEDVLSGTGENRTAWRFLGNRRQVETNANPVNVQYKKYSIVDGSALPAGDYRHNRIEFNIIDYRSKGYTYAVVTGAGLPATGIKFLMALTLKSAPELQGKSGNYLNNTSSENVRMCSYKPTATTTAYDANLADCQQFGGGGNFWTYSDTGLAALTVGTPYTFKLYKDDGWKTVNGHANATPDVTYVDELPAVPYNAAQFPNTGFASYGVSGSNSSVDFINWFKGTGGNALINPINVSNLPIGSNAMARRTVWAFSQGRTTSTASFPRVRQNNRTFPNNTDSTITLPVPGKMTEMTVVDYAETGFSSIDRNGRSITTINFFQ